MLKLFIGNKAYSSWSMRGWLAAQASGLPFEEIVVPLYDEDWDKRREGAEFAPSSGKVPILWDGDVVVWDSLAIVEYLAEKAGRDRFWPADDAARATARSMAAEMHSGFQNLRREHSMNVRRTFPHPDLSAGTQQDVLRIVSLWAEARSRWGTGGDFLFGEWGAADVMFAPVVTRFVTYGIPVPNFAASYMKAVLTHPHVSAWINAAQNETWVIERFETPRRMSNADVVSLTERLIACPSVTPADAGALGVIAHALEAQGFTVHRMTDGGPPDGPVENLFARRGSGGPHFAFAGHSDVVPAGAGWASDPFIPTRHGDLLHGRGAVDMKGAVAAFIAAAARVPDHAGTLSLIITGDEEGPATHGTLALMDWMAANDERPDMILVGEPTSDQRFGDTIKIGRRGSVNMWITVPGTQGHVAYPHLADNPATRLLRILDWLTRWTIDAGNRWFQPSNLEVTDISVGNPATNIIPGEGMRARLNIRFNDEQAGAALVDRVRAIVAEEAPRGQVEAKISGEAFLTEPGALSTLVSQAIEAVTGAAPALSTSGGTSDARFLSRLCPVVEFGLVNATMHKLDEAVAIPDLHALTDIYERVIREALTAPA